MRQYQVEEEYLLPILQQQLKYLDKAEKHSKTQKISDLIYTESAIVLNKQLQKTTQAKFEKALYEDTPNECSICILAGSPIDLVVGEVGDIHSETIRLNNGLNYYISIKYKNKLNAFEHLIVHNKYEYEQLNWRLDQLRKKYNSKIEFSSSNKRPPHNLFW